MPQRLEKRAPSGEAVVFRHDGDGGFFNWGDCQNGWFTTENSMKIDGGILGNLWYGLTCNSCFYETGLLQ